MHEQAGPPVLGGRFSSFWGRADYLAAGYESDRLLLVARSLFSRRENLAGVTFPLRRYGLTITNEPVFFAAIVAVVSWVCSLPYAWL